MRICVRVGLAARAPEVFVLPVPVQKKLAEAVERFEELEGRLADPGTAANPGLFRSLSRERGRLAKLVSLYKEYEATLAEIASNRELERDEEDPELRALAGEEVERLEARVEELSGELTDSILAEDEAGDRDVILEIRAGTGGDEAALFAADLFRMYSKYAETRRWKVEVLDSSPTELGGFKEIVVSISGPLAWRDLRHESGGHRVQRVPSTETQGRIHTSAATVAVLGEPEEVEVDVQDSDLRIDFYRAGGPGGQKVNKTSSAVRITHLPTGIVVAIQDESSQHKNRAKAMRVLRSRLFDARQKEVAEREQKERRGQIGSGDRSQRIRTYNFPQNRVTDHRLGRNFNLERVVREGEIDELIRALNELDRERRLEELAR